MLDDYKEEQKIVYDTIINSIKNNRCSHAYLIETNGYVKQQELALSIAKYILCKNNYTNNTKCGNCKQCENIDKNVFTDLKIILPDGLWIKKEQLSELKKDFKMKSFLENKIYIITDASKLNEASSNSILKFLEEPEEGIIAILLADNIHMLLNTIVSRCQVLTLKKINQEKSDTKLESMISYKGENINNMINQVLDFIGNVEIKNFQAIIDVKKLFLNNFIEKNEIIAAFEIIILYYKEIINIKLGRKTELFDNKDMQVIANKNEIEKLYKKIEIVLDLKSKIYLNANTNLLLDRLIMEIGDVK